MGATSSRGAQSSPAVANSSATMSTQATSSRGDLHFRHRLLLQQQPSLPCRGCTNRSNTKGHHWDDHLSASKPVPTEQQVGSSFESRAQSSPSVLPPAAASPGKSFFLCFCQINYLAIVACMSELFTHICNNDQTRSLVLVWTSDPTLFFKFYNQGTKNT
jgi:hypothetical protein